MKPKSYLIFILVGSLITLGITAYLFLIHHDYFYDKPILFIFAFIVDALVLLFAFRSFNRLLAYPHFKIQRRYKLVIRPRQTTRTEPDHEHAPETENAHEHPEQDYCITGEKA